MEQSYDVIVIGAGPAGSTAALYTARAGFRTLIIEKEKLGGELVDRDLIENYPGFPDGIIGPELGANMVTQAQAAGAGLQLDEVESIMMQSDRKIVKTAQGSFECRSLIIAGGAHPKKLGVPGETEFANRGVFYCATCDGPKFAGKTVVVAGGGDSGITEALLMARIAAKVIVVEMMPRMTASAVLLEKIKSEPKLETRCGVRVDAIRGEDEVKSIDLVDIASGKKSSITADGILVWVGMQANTDYLKNTVPLDERGQVIVNTDLETAVPGIFAAGDIRHSSPMQITAAVGDGATAAISARRYLSR